MLSKVTRDRFWGQSKDISFCVVRAMQDDASGSTWTGGPWPGW